MLLALTGSVGFTTNAVPNSRHRVCIVAMNWRDDNPQSLRPSDRLRRGMPTAKWLGRDERLFEERGADLRARRRLLGQNSYPNMGPRNPFAAPPPSGPDLPMELPLPFWSPDAYEYAPEPYRQRGRGPLATAGLFVWVSVGITLLVALSNTDDFARLMPKNLDVQSVLVPMGVVVVALLAATAWRAMALLRGVRDDAFSMDGMMEGMMDGMMDGMPMGGPWDAPPPMPGPGPGLGPAGRRRSLPPPPVRGGRPPRRRGDLRKRLPGEYGGI